MIRQEALNFSLSELLRGLVIPAKAEIRKVKTPDLLITYPPLGTLLGEAEIVITRIDGFFLRGVTKKSRRSEPGLHRVV